MGLEVLFIVLMLAFLIYWHIKHPDSKAVTLLYEKELLEENQNRDEDEND